MYVYSYAWLYFSCFSSATPCEPESRRQDNRLGMEHNEDMVGAGSEWSYICLLHKKEKKRENFYDMTTPHGYVSL